MYGYAVITICMCYMITCCHGASYGEDCTSSNCDDGYQTCGSITDICECITDYTMNDAGNACAGGLGKTCLTAANCADPAALCTGSTCTCNTATQYDSNGSSNGGTCTTKKNPGEQCPNPGTSGVSDTSSCMDSNSQCTLNDGAPIYTCQCTYGFTLNGGQCVQDIVNGGWTDWSGWSSCPASCGTGSQTHTRTCTNPTPQNGGNDCTGVYTESQNCNTQACPVDGGWSAWSGLFDCTATCGTGSQSRTRSCDNPTPIGTGSPCSGDNTETVTCNTNLCPVDGGWTTWTGWGTCSLTCGIGSQSRTRSCTDHSPQNSGSQCTGVGTQIQNCNTQLCPVDGGWASWTGWSQCSLTCNTGSQSRTRSCTNPTPQNNGIDCAGDGSELQNCNTQTCPVNVGWTDWTGWSGCSVTCGGGTQTRIRSCTNPSPRNNGNDCSAIPLGHQCNIDDAADICAGDNTVCHGGTCQCMIANNPANCNCQSSDMKPLIIGVVLGLIILILVVYSGYVTIKLRRSLAHKEQLHAEPNRKQQPTYVNEMFQNVSAPDGQNEVAENPEAEYSTLSDDTREPRSTYDILRV